MAANMWRSSRLSYRTVENDDDAFFHQLHADPESSLQVTSSLAAPIPKKRASELRELLQTSRLGVIMTVSPSPSVSSHASEKTSEQPAQVGFLLLRADETNQSHHRRTELGIHIRREYQGQGYGSEAIRWALRWAFRFGNLHRVELKVFGWNLRALRMYERLGFVREGVKREHLWFDGKYWDEYHLGILEREWRQLEDQGE